MKIGIEVQRLFRTRKFGIEASALELIKTLQGSDHKHEFVVFAAEGEDRNCLKASDNLKIKTVAGKLFVDFEQVFLPLAARKEQVDLLHCTGNTRPYFSPVPVVQTLHDVIFMDAIPTGDSSYQRFGNQYRRRVVPLVTPHSEVVITVSEYEKARIVERLNISPEKIHVVYNGINEERFNPFQTQGVKKSVEEKYRLPKDFILFLGNVAGRKNSRRVIEAYVRYASGSDRPLALVTPGLPEKYVRERLSELKYPWSRDQFITPGYIGEADLPALYSMSRMFLFPSLSEGFGMPVIEAMACGTPVITSNMSCLPEIAGNAAILANPTDSLDIAAAIQSLSLHEDLRANLVQAGLINAKRFSWKKTAESVLSLYELAYERAKRDHKVPGFFHRHVFATRD